MNVTELMQTYFGDAATEQLGRAAGLDLLSTRRALGVGVPLTLDVLADHAETTPGQAHVAEAIDNLPRFGSVQESLAEPDGAANLQQAGEFLSPVLLGGHDGRIVAAATASAGPGATPDRVRRLLHMTLPLLLSFLAQRGLSGTNMGVLGGLRGGVPGAGGDSRPVMNARPESQADAAQGPGAPGVLSASGLLDQMKVQFSGQNAERIGVAAGFGSGAQRATLATLPVVLNALVNKGRTEAGAADLMAQAHSYQHLTDASGNLNLSLLNDSADTGRLEAQGRGLLGGLFGNVNEVTGRLGTALGGSGTNAGRLLSLVTPLAVSLLGSRARASGLNAGGLSALLGGLSGSSLAGLLPAGLTGLSSLLGSTSAAAVSAAPVVIAAPIDRVPVVPASAAPQVTAFSTTSATTAPSRRRGFPWWLLPLLLLVLLGGCWLLQPRQDTRTQTTTGSAATTDETDAISGAENSGDASAGPDAAAQTQNGDTETASPDNATAGTAAPVTSAESQEPETTTAADGEDVSAAGQPAGAGDMAFTDPASGATLPAGGFTLRGTGTAGQEAELFEDDTSLGQVTVGENGNWSFDVPSPSAGVHSYSLQGKDGSGLASLRITTLAADAGAPAANCTEDFSLSIADGQTVSEPFRFGGKGQGSGYRVTVRRGTRVIGTRSVSLDASCGWSYESKPGPGTITYEVRAAGDAAEPISTVSLTVSD